MPHDRSADLYQLLPSARQQPIPDRLRGYPRVQEIARRLFGTRRLIVYTDGGDVSVMPCAAFRTGHVKDNIARIGVNERVTRLP